MQIDKYRETQHLAPGCRTGPGYLGSSRERLLCCSMTQILSGLTVVLIASLLSSSLSYLPPTNPPWPPTYNTSMSTLTMQCNSSGWSSPLRGAQFGIVSYDWSNAKVQWAAAKPMDCEERLLKQAEMTAALNPHSHVFVYRNLVKALPWYTAVREKIG